MFYIILKNTGDIRIRMGALGIFSVSVQIFRARTIGIYTRYL